MRLNAKCGARGLLIAAVASWAGLAAAQYPLFLPVDGERPAGVDASDRLVRVDHDLLKRWREGVDRMVLNVEDDLALEAAVDGARRTPWGYSLSGVIAVPGPNGERRGTGKLTLVIHDEAVGGTIWTPTGSWELEPTSGDIQTLRPVPAMAIQGAPPVAVEIKPPEVATAALGGDDGSEIDVLILWTPGVAAVARTEARLNIALELAVETTNDAYDWSGVAMQLNVVGMEEVDYETSGTGGVDLDRLRNPNDGFMDDIHARRDALGADLVALFVEDSNVGGVAYLDSGLNVNSASAGFSVVLYDQSAYHRSIAFAHELGHNMGLAHDLHVARKGDGVFDYSHGYVNRHAFEAGAEDGSCWYSIMAYRNRCEDAGLDGVGAPYFATPHRNYSSGAEGDGDGVPFGVPKSSDVEGEDGPADAALTLTRTRLTVANFRAERTDDANTQDEATPIAANGTVIGDFEDREDEDFFRIEVPEAGTLRVAVSSYLPFRCSLLTESGDELAAHVADRTQGESRRRGLCEAEVAAGVYWVRVAVGSLSPNVDFGDGGFPYTLSSTFDPATTEDHGDTVAMATELTLPATVSANLASATDTDVFRLVLPMPTAIRITTTGDTDTYGVLTEQEPDDSAAFRIADDDSGIGANFLLRAKAPAGRYALAVSSGGGSGDYVLEVAVDAAGDDHADVAANATRIDPRMDLDGELEVPFDLDYFRIDVPRAGHLWLRTRGGTDTMGELFAASGESLADNDDGYVWPNFDLGADLAPGAYLLRVSGWEASTGAYQLRTRYFPDDGAMPLFPAEAGLRLGDAGDGQAGFARLINRSAGPATVSIRARDDAGEALDPVELKIDAGRVVHFNSESLASGDVTGLSAGLGPAATDLRLTLETEQQVEALAYVRTEDGFVTTMHERAPQIGQGQDAWYRVAFFNPGRNRNQRSLLRVVNPARGTVRVVVEGTDDAGRAGAGEVEFTIAGRGARVLSSAELEAGGEGLSGRLGTGDGKWELRVAGFGPSAQSDPDPVSPLRVMSLLASATGHVANLSKLPALATGRIDVPLFIAAEHPTQQGFARVINESDASGTVTIHAVDDAGERFGPVALELGAGQRIHFNSDHLEGGNADLGWAEGIGDGEGHWRLELTSSLTLTVLAYVRTQDGFVTSVGESVARAADGSYQVVFFNPGRNRNQESALRLVNAGATAAEVTIEATDDAGAPAPGGTVTLNLPAGTAARLTAAMLEAGDPSFNGAFGAGSGKWRLAVRASEPITVMSLLENPTGHLTNLSSRTAAATPAP